MKQWWKDSVVYQIYPRSFCDSNGDGIGDLNGIRSKLDYLKALGVDVLWLCPIYASPNDDNGYDISDYQDIMKEFGTLADFEALLREAHERGLKILLDLVVNHTSDEHRWFQKSRSTKTGPYRDYYIWRPGRDGGPPNNWEASFGGSAWEADDATGEYYLHLFSPKQPDLNWDNPDVRGEVYRMMSWWLEKGVDGFRMDVINMISKAEDLPDGAPIPGTPYGEKAPYVFNGPHAHEYLHEMYEKVLSRYDVMTVGEAPCASVEDARRYTGFHRGELNMIFQFEHMDADADPVMNKWTERRPDLPLLKSILSKWQTGLYGEGWNSLYWSNHDQPRAVSRFGDDGAYREKSAKLLGTCLHMMQGTPFIYQGEELGMTNTPFQSIDEYNDIESRNAYREYTEKRGVNPEKMMRCIRLKSRDNARTPMHWSAEKNAGFTTGRPWLPVNPNCSTINAAAQENDESSVLSYYRKLIGLRHTCPIIRDGNFTLLAPEDPRLFLYTRETSDQLLLVACNFSSDTAKALLPETLHGKTPRLLLANDSGCEISSGSLLLRPWEARVYLYEKSHE